MASEAKSWSQTKEHTSRRELQNSKTSHCHIAAIQINSRSNPGQFQPNQLSTKIQIIALSSNQSCVKRRPRSCPKVVSKLPKSHIKVAQESQPNQSDLSALKPKSVSYHHVQTWKLSINCPSNKIGKCPNLEHWIKPVQIYKSAERAPNLAS